ncbi:unnamed protein product, partial [Ixodes hexagonus]
IKLQGTKKKGCLAMMHLKWVQLYPDFEIALQSHWGFVRTKEAKGEALRKLESALAHDQTQVRSCRRIYVSVSDMASHTEHDFDEVLAFGQTMDRNVALRIEYLVQEGITSVQEVKTCVHYYVHDVLFAGKDKPNDSCRAFFPTNADVRNHIQAALKKDRFSSLEQTNAQVLIEKYKTEQPDSTFFYRPYQTRNEKDSDDDIDDVQQLLEKECQDTLLFCYQSKFMRDIMAKYGGYAACMDATNKTTDYALPLFLVVVKTPCGYVTVGVFIVQFETQTCISEALSVLRKWCPNFQPQYWMVDYCHAEINALHETFPESKVVLCDFHREQAWDRWMRKKENCVQEKEVVLHLLRKIANSTSEEELQQSIEDLQSSAVW